VQLVPILLAFTVALVWSATGLNHNSKPAWWTAIALQCLMLVGLALNFGVVNLGDLLVDSVITSSCIAVIALLFSANARTAQKSTEGE
jgi:O-antigen/teichoic acid export membrane protein